MKRYVVAVACLVAAVCTGCKQKAGTEEPEPVAVEFEYMEVEARFVPAVSLFNPGALYQPDKDEPGLMVWKKSIDCGTALEAYEDLGAATGVETRQAERIVNKQRQQRSFVRVRYNGDDYWIQDVTVAVRAVPKVLVAESTFIYANPDVTSMDTSVPPLPFGTMVAMSAEKSSGPFICISVDTEKKTFHDVFVKQECIGQDDDIVILKLVEGIRNAKNGVLREELADALGYYSASTAAVDNERYQILKKISQNVDGWVHDETVPAFFYDAQYGQYRPEQTAADSDSEEG